MQHVQVQLIDDLNGQKAQETVSFGIDGTKYEIDLTTQNAAQLRSILSDYVDQGRKAASDNRGQNMQQGLSTTHGKPQRIQQVRQWAQTNGFNPGTRGRIPYSILEAYNNAHK
ncbi:MULTISPECIES: histone-like nucleoid-structuring protein Lsr2 [unclassified Arthrobacter]|uniref:histone-like nucleoid-structuring protein Lsr2 n=1 Tax=unclassified Arthrobacter TaxID=235627 RepID=UPI0014919D44|nr:Lsr2 family protein [Arthrobacter sp. AET 35A]NOJ63905.1 Lsr2 family protein [Arthrobacter sp. 147(2020)]